MTATLTKPVRSRRAAPRVIAAKPSGAQAARMKRRAKLLAKADQARAELAATGFKFRSERDILAELAASRG